MLLNPIINKKIPAKSIRKEPNCIGVSPINPFFIKIKELPQIKEITLELRSFIKQFIENGGTVLEENFVQETLVEETKKTEEFDNLDLTSQKIINILEEYVKPAVAADGGNIAFDSFDEENKIVKVILQGACSGCPSSTFTLKSGIESLLKTMLNDDTIVVEAANA